MKPERGHWLAALVGLAACAALTGGAILDPRNVGWLLAHPDTATSYLGWQLYRQAPLLQLPFGANPAYGLEIATSVVFSDSVPLVAFAFKPFSALLPGTFQYHGLWLALCFVLQAIFGYRLLMRCGGDRTAALLGCAFFVFAPPFLLRTSVHYALSAQWIVLAALDLYLAARAARRAWWLLLGIAALVHFYLLVMAGTLWLADLVQRTWRRELDARRAAGDAAVGAALTLSLMGFAGYFTIGMAAGATPGYGMYRLNLLALIDPDRAWSRLLPDQAGLRGDIEGFSYLGIGMLGLAALAVCLRMRRERGKPGPDRPLVVPLALVSVLLTLFALSNRVGFGAAEVLSYSIPGLLQPPADLLRGSGRMFWPVYYLICLAILAAVIRGLPRKAALASVGTLLALQLYDCAPALQQQRQRLAQAPAWASPLRSPLWTQIGARYSRVTWVQPRNALDAFIPWAVFASEHRMGLNFGYFARVDAEKLTAARNEIERAILSGRLRADSLYVFESESLWNLAAAQRRPADVAGVLDGFRIVAPGLADCPACEPGIADVKLEEAPGYVVGEPIAFGSDAGRRYPMAGWSLPEPWGVWSQSRTASLVIRLAREPTHDLLLTLEGRAFVDAGQPRQQVMVYANNVGLATLTFTSSPAAETRAVRIPHAALAGNKGLLMLRFVFPDALEQEGLPRALGLISARLERP